MLSFCYGVGWKLTLLGSAMDYGQGEAVAYEVEVSQAALDEMRQMWGLPRPSHVTVDRLLPGEEKAHVAAARQNGRAACRASVGRYVEISVVAGALKKTQTVKRGKPEDIK